MHIEDNWNIFPKNATLIEFWLQITTMGGLSPVHMVGPWETGEEAAQGDPCMYNTCDQVDIL